MQVDLTTEKNGKAARVSLEIDNDPLRKYKYPGRWVDDLDSFQANQALALTEWVGVLQRTIDNAKNHATAIHTILKLQGKNI
jgi:hypothetical protein